ncbi:MAG: 50S ribosomal protein L3 [Eubacteriales bacterium]|jgi:large subunit ribosomal protein L3|nr:50S ribosomal protein L3 [Bacillota bacterium]MBV1728195.1 50S ribosomal protein L3 [Desulforudis sp.]MDP3051722.1 50S ribosomal protein L3 [Eubacteriales bacterium]MDQ7790195.1 50S ribosomal protein L3 [Clostridia bacterium]MBU4533914.1 50S ribosomal protein L3 [Bacillota bacterium]
MAKGILGRKLGMTQIFTPEGLAVPVTLIEAGPCTVVQKKAPDEDGYSAIQLGMGARREKLITKPVRGHLAKSGLKAIRYLREIRTNSIDEYQVGQELKCDLFTLGQLVDVVGTSKGKGFAGAIKRHNFHRGPMGHGSKYHRRPGSLAAKGPARVFKGRKLPGHMGNERVTIQNLEVVKVDPERNLLAIKGAVPGPRGGLLLIKEARKAR